MPGNAATRFPVNVTHRNSEDLSSTEVVFHTINKSGTMAMENVMREAFKAHDRSEEFLSHYEIGGSHEKFVEKVEARKSRFVAGHYLYNAVPPRADRIWVTQFRHPLPKLLSSYNWIKLKKQKEGSTDFPGLEEFTVKTKGISHSSITHFSIGWGAHRKSLVPGRKPKELYEASIDALDAQVHTIAIAERFEESIFLFADLCGLPSVAPWIRDNRNPGRPLADEISDHERQVIEEVFKYDYMLYEYAIARFEKQLRETEFGDNLENYKKTCRGQYKDRIILA